MVRALDLRLKMADSVSSCSTVEYDLARESRSHTFASLIEQCNSVPA